MGRRCTSPRCVVWPLLSGQWASFAGLGCSSTASTSCVTAEKLPGCRSSVSGDSQTGNNLWSQSNKRLRPSPSTWMDHTDQPRMHQILVHSRNYCTSLVPSGSMLGRGSKLCSDEYPQERGEQWLG